MRTERVTSNLPNVRDTMAVRSRLALNAGSPPQSEETTKLKDLKENPFILKEAAPYRDSPPFDHNGDFQPPVAYGMVAYKSVERNTCLRPPAGAIISVYA